MSPIKIKNNKTAATAATPSYEPNFYPLRCTECGGEVHNKSFRVDELLNLYYYHGMQKRRLEKLVYFLGITVPFGGNVLSYAPPLLRQNLIKDEGTDIVFGPYDDAMLRKLQMGINLKAAEYSEKGAEKSACQPLTFGIEAIIAMFYRMTGFKEIYELLKLWYTGGSQNEERIDLLIEKLGNLKQIRTGAMGNTQTIAREIEDHLNFILEAAMKQIEYGGTTKSFTLKGNVSAVWTYREINDRMMPFALSFYADGVKTDCIDCLCEHCGSPMPWQFGAYEQKIIAVLGVQTSGKTSYMSALLDAIDRGEATTKVAEGTPHQTPYSIEHSWVGDVQWNRFLKTPTDNNPAAGALWLYRHGYEVKKTHAENANETELRSSPSFLVTKKGREPVMYTLADIPGESFDAFFTKAFTEDFIKKNTALLYHSDSIMLVVNVSQTEEESVIETPNIERVNESARNAQTVLASFENFKNDRKVPVAIVLTAADKVNGGNLRSPLHLAYDVRRVSPLTWSEQKGELVYNAELMVALMEAVNNFVDSRYGNFYSTLRQSAAKRWGKDSPAVASFVCSSGAQLSKRLVSMDERNTESEEKKLYESMKKARFGITAPLLWLLAQDGFLNLGYSEHRFTKYPEKMQKSLTDAVSKLLIP